MNLATYNNWVMFLVKRTPLNYHLYYFIGKTVPHDRTHTMINNTTPKVKTIVMQFHKVLSIYQSVWTRSLRQILQIVFAPIRHCPASRTTLVARRFRVAAICPIIQVPHCIRVFFYFVWFVFINHIFQFYYELCTYCNILDIYLS